MKQESCRKEVERAFGVLQSRLAIIGRPSHFWNKHVLHDMMTACIIMHNMIIEDDRDVSGTFSDSTQASIPNVENVGFQDFPNRQEQIKDKKRLT